MAQYLLGGALLFGATNVALGMTIPSERSALKLRKPHYEEKTFNDNPSVVRPPFTGYDPSGGHTSTRGRGGGGSYTITEPARPLPQMPPQTPGQGNPEGQNPFGKPPAQQAPAPAPAPAPDYGQNPFGKPPPPTQQQPPKPEPQPEPQQPPKQEQPQFPGQGAPPPKDDQGRGPNPSAPGAQQVPNYMGYASQGDYLGGVITHAIDQPKTAYTLTADRSELVRGSGISDYYGGNNEDLIKLAHASYIAEQNKYNVIFG